MSHIPVASGSAAMDVVEPQRSEERDKAIESIVAVVNIKIESMNGEKMEALKNYINRAIIDLDIPNAQILQLCMAIDG